MYSDGTQVNGAFFHGMKTCIGLASIIVDSRHQVEQI